MSWREALTLLPDAVPPSELEAAIGELEATKARLYVRLSSNGQRPESQNGKRTKPATEPDRLLKAKEAAPLLGVAERWLYDHADELPFTKRIGPRTVRFSEIGLRRFMASR